MLDPLDLDREGAPIEDEPLGAREGDMLGLRTPRLEEPTDDGKLERELLGDDRSIRLEPPDGKLLLERDRTVGEDPRSLRDEEELRSTRLAPLEGKLLLERDRTTGEDPRSPRDGEELRSTRLGELWGMLGVEREELSPPRSTRLDPEGGKLEPERERITVEDPP